MTTLSDLRLTVEAPAHADGEFRFTVLRRQYGRGSMFAVIDTGTTAHLDEAIAAAEQVAGRLGRL